MSRIRLDVVQRSRCGGTVRLYWDGVYVAALFLSNAKWLFLADLLRAAIASAGQPPDAAAVEMWQLAATVRRVSDSQFSREYQTLAELRSALAKPLQRLNLGGPELRLQLIEQLDGLGYRIGLPSENLSFRALDDAPTLDDDPKPDDDEEPDDESRRSA
jgi:hypothetical protein